MRNKTIHTEKLIVLQPRGGKFVLNDLRKFVNECIDAGVDIYAKLPYTWATEGDEDRPLLTVKIHQP